MQPLRSVVSKHMPAPQEGESQIVSLNAIPKGSSWGEGNGEDYHPSGARLTLSVLSLPAQQHP